MFFWSYTVIWYDGTIKNGPDLMEGVVLFDALSMLCFVEDLRYSIAAWKHLWRQE